MNLSETVGLLVAVVAERRLGVEVRTDAYGAPMDEAAKALGSLVAALAKRELSNVEAARAAPLIKEIP